MPGEVRLQHNKTVSAYGPAAKSWRTRGLTDPNGVRPESQGGHKDEYCDIITSVRGDGANSTHRNGLHQGSTNRSCVVTLRYTSQVATQSSDRPWLLAAVATGAT